jgi:hypothetical protein
MVERVDPRVDGHRRSILALHAFLTELATNPPKDVHSESVVGALKSQGSLAAFEDHGKGISKMSLNTAKRVADTVVPGGFTELDRLRQRCAGLLSQEPTAARPGYGTKEELRRQKQDIEQDAALLRQDLLICTKVLELSMQQGRRYAKEAGGTVEALCRKEQRELFAYLTARSFEALAEENASGQAVPPDRP